MTWEPAVHLDTIPRDLTLAPRWVCWRYEDRGGKPTKIPFSVHTGHEASSTNPATWADFANAAAYYIRLRTMDGIGFCLGDGWAGVDLDKCRNPETGSIDAWATEAVAALNSYTEVSPSGTGLKVFLRGVLPPGPRRRGQVEIYCQGRYFTVTGLWLPGTPTSVIENRQADLEAFHGRIFQAPAAAPVRPPTVAPNDREIIEKAIASTHGEVFLALWHGDTGDYSSPSEADLALVSRLMFWTRGDTLAVDRLFRQSGLMRPKWDERHGEKTYGQMTIDKARHQPIASSFLESPWR